MTFGIVSLIVAFGVGFIVASVGFAYLNRKAPGIVDSTEAIIRDFNKKS